MYFSIAGFLVLDAPSAMRQILVIGNDDFARPGVSKTDFYWKPTAADQGTRVVCVEATDTYGYVTSTIYFTNYFTAHLSMLFYCPFWCFRMSAQHCISLAVWGMLYIYTLCYIINIGKNYLLTDYQNIYR